MDVLDRWTKGPYQTLLKKFEKMRLEAAEIGKSIASNSQNLGTEDEISQMKADVDAKLKETRELASQINRKVQEHSETVAKREGSIRGKLTEQQDRLKRVEFKQRVDIDVVSILEQSIRAAETKLQSILQTLQSDILGGSSSLQEIAMGVRNTEQTGERLEQRMDSFDKRLDPTAQKEMYRGIQSLIDNQPPRPPPKKGDPRKLRSTGTQTDETIRPPVSTNEGRLQREIERQQRKRRDPSVLASSPKRLLVLEDDQSSSMPLHAAVLEN